VNLRMPSASGRRLRPDSFTPMGESTDPQAAM
jgi:hypothetical protein